MCIKFNFMVLSYSKSDVDLAQELKKLSNNTMYIKINYIKHELVVNLKNFDIINLNMEALSNSNLEILFYFKQDASIETAIVLRDVKDFGLLSDVDELGNATISFGAEIVVDGSIFELAKNIDMEKNINA